MRVLGLRSWLLRIHRRTQRPLRTVSPPRRLREQIEQIVEVNGDVLQIEPDHPCRRLDPNEFIAGRAHGARCHARSLAIPNGPSNNAVNTQSDGSTDNIVSVRTVAA